jgi:hypothetical protein
MLDFYRASGTLFYRVLGKGFHGSRYGAYLLPTANIGVQNVLAFLHGIANTLCAGLAAGNPWKNQEGLISLTQRTSYEKVRLLSQKPASR